MTHYYTHGVPTEIGRKLLNSGMELKRDELTESWLVPTYAEAIDWLLEKGMSVEIQKGIWRGCDWYAIVTETDTHRWEVQRDKNDWYSVTNHAIERALILLKERTKQ